jgi:hypothetical protein
VNANWEELLGKVQIAADAPDLDVKTEPDQKQIGGDDELTSLRIGS